MVSAGRTRMPPGGCSCVLAWSKYHSTLPWSGPSSSSARIACNSPGNGWASISRNIPSVRQRSSHVLHWRTCSCSVFESCPFRSASVASVLTLLSAPLARASRMLTLFPSISAVMSSGSVRTKLRSRGFFEVLARIEGFRALVLIPACWAASVLLFASPLPIA